MSYYNSIIVIFRNNLKLDWRFAGQVLPQGSIPVAIHYNITRTTVEIINDFDRETIVEFIRLNVPDAEVGEYMES